MMTDSFFLFYGIAFPSDCKSQREKTSLRSISLRVSFFSCKGYGGKFCGESRQRQLRMHILEVETVFWRLSMKNTAHIFLGANSAQGFYSLYDQLLSGHLDDLMIIKGGPGCGKSTFMRRVAEKLTEAERMPVYIHCSGDPDSLDGVIFPELHTALVDGTPPHGTATKGHFFGTSYQKIQA